MEKNRCTGGMIGIIKIPLFVLSLLLLLTGCGKEEKLVLSGTVEAEQVDVNSEVAGKVLKLQKEEGELLKKDDVLAILDSSMQELTVKQQEAVVRLKQAKLDEIESGARTEQIRQAEAAVESAGASKDGAEAAVATAQINYDYWLDKYNEVQSLRDAGAVSEAELKDARYKADTAQQQLVTARKQVDSANSQLKSVRAQLDMLNNGSTGQAVKAAEADVEQSKQALEQAKLVLSKYEIKSPADGTYLSRNINIGDILGTGGNAATVADLNNLWVRVYIPQHSLGKIALNQEVVLSTPSLPQTAIKGKIVNIANEAEFTPKNTETNDAKENTVFKVKIKIMDNIARLKPGMTVEAAIL